MDNEIILSVDSSVDLDKDILEKYNVKINTPIHIILEGKSYDDMVDVTPDMIFDNYFKTGNLPKTSAANCQEFIEKFKPFVDDGYEIIHISIGNRLSTSYSQSCLAAEELGNIYVINSQNVTTGAGMIVAETAKRISQGMAAKDIVKEIEAIIPKVCADFVLEKLTFLHAGGRCSAVEMFGANLLKLRPCIIINSNDGGSLSIGKKYRGNIDKVFKTYADEKLANLESYDDARIFITHSNVDKDILDQIYKLIESKNYFKEILVTKAGCTVSSHWGPGTLGLVCMKK